MTSLVEIYRRFPTKEAAIAHLEHVRWPKGPTCPYCGCDTIARHNEAARRDRLQCWSCNRSFSPTVGTIFHHSHVDLQQWFLLIALMLGAKKGLSSMQAARDLDMRQATVWSMMHRIRGAMQDDGRLLAGLVEMDEAYIGGKPRKRNRRDDDTPSPRGRGTSKTPVVGAVRAMRPRAMPGASSIGYSRPQRVRGRLAGLPLDHRGQRPHPRGHGGDTR